MEKAKEGARYVNLACATESAQVEWKLRKQIISSRVAHSFLLAWSINTVIINLSLH